MSDQPCDQCGQWDWHPLHTGKNSATGEVEGPIDHAPVHSSEPAPEPLPADAAD